MSENGTDRYEPPVFWRSDRVSGLALLAFALAVAFESRVLPMGTLAHPGPGAMPLGLALLLTVLSILIVVSGNESPLLKSLRWGEARHALAVLGASGFAALALEVLGYRLTIAGLLVFLLGVVERRSLAMVGAFAVGVPVATYFVFAQLLKVPLPIGPWGI